MENTEKNDFNATIGNTVLGDASGEFNYPSLMDSIMRDFYKKSSQEFDDHLKNYVIKNLKDVGFEFKSDKDFLDFVSKRITRIGYQNKPNEWELILDYGCKNQKLIGLYNDKVTFSNEGSKVTATFGRTFRLTDIA